MIETEICESAIYNVFACQTMTKVGLPVYEASKCAPRNRKEPCASQKIRHLCLRTTEDENFGVESELDCVWCVSGNCAVDQKIRCATRKFMNDIGQNVSPTHKQNVVVGTKNDKPIVEHVDSVGTYEYCKVVPEGATEMPSSAPTAFGRSVDIARRVTQRDLLEGYLRLRDANSGDWGLVCNAGISKSMRELSCSEMGYGATYEVDVNKKYYHDMYHYGWRRNLNRDGTSITHWKEKWVKDMDGFSKDYKGDWYKINSCKGDEDSLNECSYTKTSSCSEGVFVIGCQNFERKPGCSNYVAKVSWSDYSYSTHYSHTDYSDGIDVEHGLIFQLVDGSKRKLVYTDYEGRQLKTGEVPIHKEGLPSEAWKDTLTWEQIQGDIHIEEFHTQCGGFRAQSILLSFASSKFTVFLAVIGVFSLMYLACKKSESSDFTLVTEEET